MSINKTLVFGHKNPDTDSIMSSLVMANLENQLGNEAKAVRLGNINKETEYVINYLGIEAPEFISDIEDGQKSIERKLAKIETVVDAIDKDIYDESDTEFEIVCPYCNNEFISEINYEGENEIECPECHNIIEIDINADVDEDNYGCHGGCNKCKGCNFNSNDDEEDDM